jgi:LPXTG-motif cell wall-anchored protein
MRPFAKRIIALSLCAGLVLSGTGGTTAGQVDINEFSTEEALVKLEASTEEAELVESTELAEAETQDAEKEQTLDTESETETEADTEAIAVESDTQQEADTQDPLADQKEKLTEEENRPTQVLTYNDGTVLVTVSAEDGVIPEGATLRVVPIVQNETETTELQSDSDAEEQTETTAEDDSNVINVKTYEEVEEELLKDAEENEYELLGFLAYDISFEKDGVEIEPDGDVTVTMDYVNPVLPEGIEGAADANVTVMHLEENTNGEVENVVDLSADEKVSTLTTTENQEIEKAEFVTDSFSTFTITWAQKDDINATKYIQISVHYVDENGVAIKGKNTKDLYYTYYVNKNYDFTSSEYRGNICGYKYSKTCYGTLNGSDVTNAIFSYDNGNYNVTFKNGDAVVDTMSYSGSGDIPTADIYLVYTLDLNPDDTYSVILYRNRYNKGGTEQIITGSIDLTALTADENGIVTVNLSGIKPTNADNGSDTYDGKTYYFYGWSTLPDANGRSDSWIYPSDTDLEISTSEFDYTSKTLSLYAVWGYTHTTSSYEWNVSSDYLTMFSMRYDGTIPYEPSSSETKLYQSVKTKVSNAVSVYKHIYNDSDAVEKNIADGKEPTASEIASAINTVINAGNLGNLQIEVQNNEIVVTQANTSNTSTSYPQFDKGEVLYVEWYVMKYDSSDGWHIDGTLLSKGKWTLEYDANCNTSVSNIISKTQYGTNATAIVHNTEDSNKNQSDVEPSRAGYIFKDWNTEPDGTGKTYKAGEEIEPQEAGTTFKLYAQWSNGSASLNLQKTDEYGNPLSGAKFVLDGNTKNMYTLTDGNVTINDIDLNVIHTLKEVQAPTGYTTRKDPVYFKIEKVDGSYQVTFYDNNTDAAKEIETPDGISASNTTTDITLTIADKSVTRNVIVTKMWDDDNNKYNARPSELEVTLIAKVNGKKIEALSGQTYTLKAEEDWKYTFKNVPAYYGGEEITYSAEEGTVESIYQYEQVGVESETPTVEELANAGVEGVSARAVAKAARNGGTTSSSSVDHIDIATALTATVVINGKKTTQQFTFTADDVENNLTIVGKKSTGTVYDSSTATITTSTSTDSSGNPQIRIQGTFPVGTLSDPVYYTVTLNKTITVTEGNQTYEVPVTLTITTNYWDSGNKCPGLGMGTTNWKNGSVVNGSGIDLQFGAGLASTGTITVQKTIEGVTLTEDKTFTFDILSDGSLYKTVEVTVKAGSTTAVNMITGVPYGTYTIEEETSDVAIAGYSCDTPIATTLTIDGTNQNAYFNAVNTYTDQTFKVTVTKEWSEDNDSSKVRPTSVTATVYYSDGSTEKITLSDDTWSWTSAGGTKTIVDVREDMTSTVGNKTLGDYYTSSVSIAGDGKSATLTNTLKETKEPDTEETGTEQPEEPEEEVEPDIVAEDVYIYLTNRLQYEDITLKKIWDDSVDTSHRPTSIQVTLSIINDKTQEVAKACGSYYITNSNSSQVDGKTVWTKTINLPKLASGYSYQMTENWSNDYYRTPEYSDGGLTVTNTLRKRDITVVKIWDDANNAFETRPKSITVILLKDGAEYQECTLQASDDPENDWRYTFKAVDLGAYSVREENVKTGYTPIYNTDSTIFAITNVLEINWVIKKVSATAPDIVLKDAKFTLKGQGENANQQTTLTTDSYGTVTINSEDFSIVNGTAILEEIEAPAGYSLSDTRWIVTFEDGVITKIVDEEGGGTSKNAEVTYTQNKETGAVEVVVTIKDEVLYELPSAGGEGIFLYLIAGMLLMMGGALLIFVKRRKVLRI